MERQLNNMRIILSALEGTPKRYMEILNKTIPETGSHNVSKYMLAFCVEHEYIKKASRGVYEITEKGVEILRALKYSEEHDV